jgi:hypothetical protein
LAAWEDADIEAAAAANTHDNSNNRVWLRIVFIVSLLCTLGMLENVG